MVALRSRKQDRTLLVVLWVFTAIVLVLGGFALSPILLVWGTVGLIAAIYLTRIHIRDTRGPGDGPGTGGGLSGQPGPDATQAPDATQTETVEKDAQESR
jgi:hypothetical protein